MHRTLLIGISLTFMAGCGSMDEMEIPPSPYVPGFTPPAAESGEQTYVSPVLKDIQPGTDVTLCTYLDNRVAVDTDVLHFRVFQSRAGHHAIVYAARKERPVGTHVCTEDDMVNSRFIAGSGGEGVGTLPIPEGLAFRIPAHSQLMIQSHWINATPASTDGQVVAYLTAQPAAPDRSVLDLFNIILSDITIPARQEATQSTTCIVKKPLQLYTLTGHEHEWGKRVTIEQVGGPGPDSMLWANDWKPEYQSNPPYNIYSVAKPLVLMPGQSLRVTCTWDNTKGDSDLSFPREMCVGSGFYFPARGGEIDCENGVWSEQPQAMLTNQGGAL